MFRYSRRLVVILTFILLAWFSIQRYPIFIAVTFREDVLERPRNPPHSSLSSSSPDIQTQRQISTTPNPEPEKSIHIAIFSFTKYGDAASEFLRRKFSRFDKLSIKHRALADTIGYSQHFQTARRAVDENAGFAERVAKHAKDIYGVILPSANVSGEEDEEYRNILLPFQTVNDAFGHLVRDWSQESHAERDQVFPPILDALERHLAGVRGEKKILLPGFGLGRLGHEIAEKGYNVEACELDHSAIIAYHYILNCTKAPFEHTLYPFATQWTHQPNSTLRFQSVRIPDVIPSKKVKLVEGNFLTEFTEEAVYDAVVTLFFIDMSVNVIDFLETISKILKPGGLWVNLGPFKWGPSSQMQPSAKETLQLANMLGLQVDNSSYQAIDTTYAHQPESLLKFTYVTQFWTARKNASSSEDNQGH